jgi:chemotaxis protein MotB
MSNDSNQPVRIIVKRVHGAHDDEHGGQWKIAYADFVTAMMAFFLIMWLLASTTPVQRDGIANFFNSAGGAGMPAGNGIFEGGSSVLIAGDAPVDQADGAADGGIRSEQDGGIPAPASEAQDASSSNRNAIERQRFEALKAEVERMMSATNGDLREFAQSISVEIIPDGLRLQLTDRDGLPMFNPGAIEPTPRLARILTIVGGILGTVPNEIVVAGHTDGQRLVRGTYGNWELSSERANNARRVLERGGLNADRIFRVEGKAASEPPLNS